MVVSQHILAAGFVTPAFAIAGLALASVPIIIHLLNRRRYKVVQWAAMDFLLRAMKKNRRRLKFEQWLLLLARCAMFALLGLALARPVGCNNSALSKIAAQRAGLHVIVIDNSGSMAYRSARDGATHLARAKQLATQQIERLSSGTEAVSIVTTASPATIELKTTYDLDAARVAVDRIEQTYADTDLAGAMQRVAEIGRTESRQPERHLHLFTDSTRVSWEGDSADALKQVAPDLAKQFEVAHYNVGEAGQDNAAAVDLKPSSNLVTSAFPVDFLATLRQFGPQKTVQTQWKLDEAILPGGESVSIDATTEPITQSQARFTTGGPHVLTVSMQGGDALRADDTRYRVIDVASQLKTLIVEGNRSGGLESSGSFLALALSPPRMPGETGTGYIATDVIGELELGNKVLDDYAAVILAGVGQMSSTQADALARYVQAGGSLVVFMGGAVSADTYNTTLLPRKLLPGPLVKRMSAGDGKPYAFDFKPLGPVNPMLKAFERQENSGLDTAQVFTYWQVSISPDSGVERVLDYLPESGTDGGGRGGIPAARDPAITVQSLGAGRIVFFSTSADWEWTTLPAKAAYVAVMNEIVSGSITTGDAWMNHAVGEPVVLPQQLKLTAAPTLTDSSGTPVQFDVTKSPPTSVPLTKPGLYMLNTGNRTIPIAVNMSATESDVRTVDGSVIKAVFGDQNVSLYDNDLAPMSAAATGGNDFGWIVMAVATAFIVTESFLAMRFGHHRKSH